MNSLQAEESMPWGGRGGCDICDAVEAPKRRGGMRLCLACYQQATGQPPAPLPVAAPQVPQEARERISLLQTRLEQRDADVEAIRASGAPVVARPRCSVEGCSAVEQTGGLCRRHRAIARRAGTTTRRPRQDQVVAASRDQQVLEAYTLQPGLRRQDAIELLGCSAAELSASLTRLRRSGQIARSDARSWHASGADAQAPTTIRGRVLWWLRKRRGIGRLSVLYDALLTAGCTHRQIERAIDGLRTAGVIAPAVRGDGLLRLAASEGSLGGGGAP